MKDKTPTRPGPRDPTEESATPSPDKDRTASKDLPAEERPITERHR